MSWLGGDVIMLRPLTHFNMAAVQPKIQVQK